MKAFRIAKIAVTAVKPTASVSTAAPANTGARTQRAERVMDVAPRVVEPPEAAAIAIGLLHLLDSPEVASRGQACLFGRQPSAFVVACQQVEMAADFFVKRRVE